VAEVVFPSASEYHKAVEGAGDPEGGGAEEEGRDRKPVESLR